MQNATVTLTADQSATRAHYLAVLSPMVGISATISFVKRDGEARTITGEVVEVLEGATPDKGAVRVLTSEGFRSANLFLITAVRDACHACGNTSADHDADSCHTMAAEVAHKRATVGW